MDDSQRKQVRLLSAGQNSMPSVAAHRNALQRRPPRVHRPYTLTSSILGVSNLRKGQEQDPDPVGHSSQHVSAQAEWTHTYNPPRDAHVSGWLI